MRKHQVHEHKHDSNYRPKVVVMMMIVVVLKDEMRHSAWWCDRRGAGGLWGCVPTGDCHPSDNSIHCQQSLNPTMGEAVAPLSFGSEEMTTTPVRDVVRIS